MVLTNESGFVLYIDVLETRERLNKPDWQEQIKAIIDTFYDIANEKQMDLWSSTIDHADPRLGYGSLSFQDTLITYSMPIDIKSDADKLASNQILFYLIIKAQKIYDELSKNNLVRGAIGYGPLARLGPNSLFGNGMVDAYEHGDGKFKTDVLAIRISDTAIRTALDFSKHETTDQPALCNPIMLFYDGLITSFGGSLYVVPKSDLHQMSLNLIRLACKEPKLSLTQRYYSQALDQQHIYVKYTAAKNLQKWESSKHTTSEFLDIILKDYVREGAELPHERFCKDFKL